MDSIGTSIGVVNGDLSPWYSVKVTDLKPFGISGMLGRIYGDSIPRMLLAAYPEYDWYPHFHLCFINFMINMALKEKVNKEIKDWNWKKRKKERKRR